MRLNALDIRKGVLASWLARNQVVEPVSDVTKTVPEPTQTVQTTAPVQTPATKEEMLLDEREIRALAMLPPNFDFKTIPWLHQKVGVALQIPFPNFAFLYEVGSGKSKTALDCMRYRYGVAGRLLKTLIVCPPIVIRNWPNEFKTHTNIYKGDIVPLVGDGKQRLATLRANKNFTRIFVTNFETLLNPEIHKELLEYDFDIICVDEAHYLKNPTSKRSKAVYALGDKARFRYALTGTPILNSPMDIFGIFRFLDKGETFGKNQFGFRNLYFYDKNANMPKQQHFPNWQPRPTMMPVLAEKIATLSHHVKKEDCLDLPPFVRKKVFCDLSPEQKRLYDEMKRDLLAIVENKGVAYAQLAITKVMRMMQIISGHVKIERLDNEGKTHKEIHTIAENPRLEVLADLLETYAHEHKIIVWAVYGPDYKAIGALCERLGFPHVEVHGDCTPKEKDAAVYSFNNDPKTRVFVGHPKAGGIGINLVISDISIYYSRTFDLGDDIQSEARNYRGGSEIHKSITRFDIVAFNTIDEKVLERLELKQAIGEDILVNLVKEAC